jgi:DNA-binding NtrC family response regulator
MHFEDDKHLLMGMGGLMGVSLSMQRVYKLIHTAGLHHYPVLIVGEHGTGKGAAARSIHSFSRRKDSTFVSVSCARRAPPLREAELFGRTGGSQGLVSFAGSGTVFLDEIAELGLYLQTKLLQTLHEKAVWPIDSIFPVPFNARVISATHRDLAEQVSEGAFCQDLFLELSALRIELRPLRERKNDIPLLVDYFIERYTEPGSRVVFSAAAMNYLLAYDWPGNVRELEATVQRALSFASDPVSVDLQRELRNASPGKNESPQSQECELERDAIVRALRETAGDTTAAARSLGIGKTTLRRRLMFHGLEF